MLRGSQIGWIIVQVCVTFLIGSALAQDEGRRKEGHGRQITSGAEKPLGIFFCMPIHAKFKGKGVENACFHHESGPSCEKYLRDNIKEFPETPSFCKLVPDQSNEYRFLEYNPYRGTITKVEILDMRRFLGRD
jgi:hypothetical protein